MSALIETVRVRDARAPLWPRHMARLERSCRALGLPIPAIPEPIGGDDRVVRFEVGPGTPAPRVTERPVGELHPVRLVFSEEPHPEYPHKTTERESFELALAEARGLGADDALLLTVDGWVAEACIWTLFWWEGDRLATPALDLGVLPGVARGRLEELRGGLEERRIKPHDLAGRSLLVANAIRGVVPVVRLGGRRVPDHPLTGRLVEAFWP